MSVAPDVPDTRPPADTDARARLVICAFRRRTDAQWRARQETGSATTLQAAVARRPPAPPDPPAA